MFRFAIPIILIGVAVTGFFMFVRPDYQTITDLRAKAVSYDQALSNSKSLEAERDKLTAKYNSIDLDNLTKLQKLLPDNVDNIRLILEIEKIASPYGMVLKDVKYDTTSGKDTTTTKSGIGAITNNDYGTWNLEFSTQGTYPNFLNFVKDLESNLRIVDISSIDFSSNTSPVMATGTGNTGTNTVLSNSYKYTFKIKTYWLKN